MSDRFSHLSDHALALLARENEELADRYAAEEPAPVGAWRPCVGRDAAGRDVSLHGCCQRRAATAQAYRRELARRRVVNGSHVT